MDELFRIHEQNNIVNILLGEDNSNYFNEVSIIMQKMFKLTIGDLTLRPRHDMTFYTFFTATAWSVT